MPHRKLRDMEVVRFFLDMSSGSKGMPEVTIGFFQRAASQPRSGRRNREVLGFEPRVFGVVFYYFFETGQDMT